MEEGNVNFKKGDFVAIRGISGIGKSTLLKMLLGVFKPQSGNIRLYKNDGSFVEASPDTRCLFSYVPQGNYLFSGTLRENILLINPNATDSEIREALEISDILEFVNKLPEGLDTVIGEKGLGISEGQAQRLAIARALLSKAPIILLDEATSALDAKTERNVLSRIKNLNMKTCIIITHKKAALDVCTKNLL
ncbi:MAG: ATP-binding cassette domain-containing protein [Eubacterium sp.]